MFVICDIEWAINDKKQISLTQIAASRVNEKWHTLESFFSLARPQNASFEDWEQVCYAGHKSIDFLHAPSAYTVLLEFEAWLKEDDIILWWYDESLKTMKSFFRILFKKSFDVPSKILVEYMPSFLNDGKMRRGNPYHLAQKRGIKTPYLKHESANDVKAIQKLFMGINFPQEMLNAPPPPAPIKESYTQEQYPFQYDEIDKLLHKVDCEFIPQDHPLKGYTKLEKCLVQKLRPCPMCLKADMLEARRQRNRDILSRSQYNYIYSPTSTLFHRYDCSIMLNANNILGTVTYDAIEKTGRKPCKVCHPTKNDEWVGRKDVKIPKKVPKKQKITRGSINSHEKKAIGRFKAASEERKAALASGYSSETEKNDIYTLTQPEFSFWAGSGYSTFHIRTCPKIAGLSNLRGFKYYDAAIRAGFSPCKHCKPSPKHNTEVSIPIYNQIRADETVEDLKELCERYNYEFGYTGTYVTIETPVGKWRINVNTRPVKVEHANLAYGGNPKYHMQHRIFLSLTDTFRYIERHDTTLEARIKNEKGESTDEQ